MTHDGTTRILLTDYPEGSTRYWNPHRETHVPRPERHWLVVGRISGSDEDTACVVKCRTEKQAIRAYKEELAAGIGLTPPKKDWPTMYINTVAVSDTLIDIITYQW